jgi:hypothetical protein
VEKDNKLLFAVNMNAGKGFKRREQARNPENGCFQRGIR